MNLAGLLFLILAQFFTGRGLLGMFNIKLKPIILFFVSEMIGVVMFSFIPMIIEFAHVPITKTSVLTSICITTVLFAIIPFKRYDFSVLKPANIKFTTPKLYELLMVFLLVFLMIPSLWRGFLYPAYSRDVLSGPEALAEYTLKEHSLDNSVFTVNLMKSTPNLLKPPFITDLQIIYKMFVHPFGKTWLSIIVVCFLVWLYHILREKLHPVLAGAGVLLLLSIPELYGYTYILLWDYSNMVFFFTGYYFLMKHFKTKQQNIFLFSCLMFGFATFIRLDTLLFIAPTGLLAAYILWKDKVKLSKIILNVALLGIIPFIFYFTWVEVFVKYYLPLNLSTVSELNLNPEHGYFEWFKAINKGLFFGGLNYVLYGLYIYIFLGVLIAETIFFRKQLSRDAAIPLIGVLIVYLCLPAMIYATAWFNMTTAKRGIFKAFPLMLLFMSNSTLLQRFSQLITDYENKKDKQKNVTTAQVKRKPNQTGRKKGKKLAKQ